MRRRGACFARCEDICPPPESVLRRALPGERVAARAPPGEPESVSRRAREARAGARARQGEMGGGRSPPPPPPF